MPDKDPHDALELAHGWGDWSGKILRQYVDLWLEIQASRDLISPADSTSLATRQTYPYLSREARNSPFMRDPETYASCSLMAANVYQRTVGDNEFVVLSSDDKQEDPAVATQTKLMRRVWRLPGQSHTYYKTCLDMATFGLGWLANPISPVHEMTLAGTRRDVGEGASVMDYAPKMNSRMENIWEPISIYDMLPDWSRPFGRQMQGGMRVGRMSETNFKAFAEKLAQFNEMFKGTKIKGFSQDALDKALEKNGDSAAHSQPESQRWRELAMRAFTEQDIQLPDGYRPIMYFEWRGEVPWEAVDSVNRYQLILIANNELIFQGPQPYWPHPWRCMNMLPSNARNFGIGVAEAGRFEQDELDTFRWLRAQAAIKTVNAPTLYDGNLIVDSAQLEQPASDQIIEVTGGGDVSHAAAQMSHNFAPLFAAAQLLAEDRQVYRQGVGIPDILRGAAAGARTTAREIGELSVTGNVPIDVRINLLEGEDLPDIARDIPQRYLLALRDEKINGQPAGDFLLAKMLGSPNARLEHLERSLSIVFQGNEKFSQKGGFGGIVQGVSQLLQINPALSQFINFPQLAADMLKIVSQDAAERYLLDPSSAVGQAAAAQAFAQGGPGQGTPSPPRVPQAAQ